MNLVALTGAGISKASGIPTFNEMGNLREKLSRSFFQNNPEEFYKILIEMKEKIERAEPNPAHIALAKYNVPIVTMNIDGLHKRAGSKNIIEIHGNLEYVECPNCNELYDFDVVKGTIYCKKCRGLLQPNVVLYGDIIPLYFNAIDLIGSADELLVVGTSFYTSTAIDLVNRAKFAGIKVTMINENAEENVPKYLKKLIK
ncbi:Sir2 family NAD-dependent protein deacetylase [Caloramator sp. CAR-1]|uniref:SIR2 family NAD-dependent protein deacylase n=1 Tax=Caloramator sp. CAR-1 TaxID=3062777 RepID=UPI0026E12B23|nr:Sir2 family NAD-dependent protein deacetylase [Caloramator sp. CAR-1]MDO6354813.1 Sir2 family NAD-dependent protein deacetylase [Caloramator sp. CAR-1]